MHCCLFLTALCPAVESDGVDVSDELNSCLLEMDKSSLRAFTAYLKAGKQARALEVAQGLHAERSLEGKWCHQQPTIH
jgi:hypothetical protein